MEIDQTCHTKAECLTLFNMTNMTVKDNKCLTQCPEGSVFDVSVFCIL